jgi:hypothetical protein
MKMNKKYFLHLQKLLYIMDLFVQLKVKYLINKHMEKKLEYSLGLGVLCPHLFPILFLMVVPSSLNIIFEFSMDDFNVVPVVISHHVLKFRSFFKNCLY